MCILTNEKLRGMIKYEIVSNFIIGIITGITCGIIADVTGKNIVVVLWFVYFCTRTICKLVKTITLVDLLLNYSTEDEP